MSVYVARDYSGWMFERNLVIQLRVSTWLYGHAYKLPHFETPSQAPM
jgi:hypothetical protein